MGMETYLARMFNYGATLVNIFSWGIGGEANKNIDFRVVTEGEEALHAYGKFLRGQRLVEVVSSTSSYLERLPAKIHRIQRELPAWIQKTGNQAKAEALLHRLDAALKKKNFTEAEKVADEILSLLPAK
jgi:N-glycosylase/DNA lyase